MSEADFAALVLATLAAGCGGLIAWVLTKIFQDRDESGKPVSPRDKRRVAALACIVVPTVIYLFAAFVASWTTYTFGMNAAYVAAAFMACTILHGETQLPTLEQKAKQDAEKANEVLVDHGLAPTVTPSEMMAKATTPKPKTSTG